MRAENEVRESFTLSERVELKRAIDSRIGERSGERTDLLPQEFAEVPPGVETRECAAIRAGFGNAGTARQVDPLPDDHPPERRAGSPERAASLACQRAMARLIEAARELVARPARH